MSLIAITTHKGRKDEIQSFLSSYSDLANSKENKVIVSIDGGDEEMKEYSMDMGFDTLMSERSEGVGISKNRVLTTFPDYKNYFFIEDDVECVNPEYFEKQIIVAEESGIGHFVLHPVWRLREIMQKMTVLEYEVAQAMFGSAQINYFSWDVISKIGGWHDMFAKYCRYGHTEHTYRIVNNGLCKFPFNLVTNFVDDFVFWEPQNDGSAIDVEIDRESRISKVELDLMKEKIKHYPIITPAGYKKYKGKINSPIEVILAKKEVKLSTRMRTNALGLKKGTLKRMILLSFYKFLNAISL